MSNWKRLGMGLVAVGLMAGQGFAVEPDTQEWGISGGLEFTDSIDLDVTYGYFLTSEWEVKGTIGATWQDMGDEDFTSIWLGGLVDYHLTALDVPEYILPYVEVGAGYMNSDFGAVSDAEESNNDAFVLVLGMGAKYFLADNTALNAGLFYQWASEDVFLDEGDPDDNQFLIRVGLNFYY